MIGFSEDEALAAEYALGTLDHDERTAAAQRRRTDRSFDALVRDWELRLAPLATASLEIAPPPAVFERLLVRVGQDGKPERYDNVVAMRRQVRLWRGVAGIATALAAMLAVWVAERETAGLGAAQTYVAVLQQGSGAPTFVVSLDLANRRMSVRPLGTTAPPDKSYELWMIGSDAKPRSMGVVDTDGPVRPPTPDVDRSVLSGATYAVTIEPRGGSPNGKPTSAPVFVGKMVNTSL